LLIPSFEIEREAHGAPPDVEASILGVESEPWLLDGVDFRGNRVENTCERLAKRFGNGFDPGKSAVRGAHGERLLIPSFPGLGFTDFIG
jgi:hypothetical protein